MDISGLNDTLSDDEFQSAAKVLESLTNAWINEKNSPELLKHKTDLIECVLDQIQQVEENLQNLNRDDFRLVLHQMEIDRIRYLISSYLRVRLQKIEQFTYNVLQREENITDENEKYLSDAELKFAKDYLNNFKQHCFNEAFKYMPTMFHNFGRGDSDLDITPNLSSTVFIRVVKNIDDILICDQLVKLQSGSRHLLPYKDVADLIKSGAVYLI